MKNKLLFFTLIFGFQSWAQMHPDYKKMKPYYSYFVITESQGFQHQFKVFSKEHGVVTLGLNDPNDFADKKIGLYHHVIAGSTALPQNKEDYPIEFEPLVLAIKKNREHVDAIKYLGRFALIGVKQWIPTDYKQSDEGKEESLIGYSAETTYKFYETKAPVETAVMSAAWGWGKICTSYFPECKSQPEVVNYTLPTNLEFTSLIGASLGFIKENSQVYPKQPEYEEEVKKFLDIILHSGLEKAGGTFKSALNPVVAVHEKTGLIPDGMKQSLSYSLNIIAHVGNKFPYKRSDIEDVAVKFSVKELLKSEEVSQVVTSKYTGIKIKVTVSLKNKFLSLSTQMPEDKEFRESVRVDFKDIKDSLLTEGIDTILTSLPKLKDPDSYNKIIGEMEIKGIKDYSGIFFAIRMPYGFNGYN